MKPSCEELHEDFTPHLEGKLGAQRAARLQEHLVSCPSCEAAFALERLLLESLRGSQPQLSATFNQAVLARAAALQNPPWQNILLRASRLPWAASLVGMSISVILFGLLHASLPTLSWTEFALSLFSFDPILIIAALWLAFFVIYVNEKYLERLMHPSPPPGALPPGR